MRIVRNLLLVVVALIISVSSAQAGPIQMKITLGLSNITIVDNSASDSSAELGTIEYRDLTDTGGMRGWTFRVVGTNTASGLNLFIQDAVGYNANYPLIIRFSETDYAAPGGGVAVAANGNVQGSLSVKTFASAGNTFFGLTTPMTSQVFTESPYSGTTSGDTGTMAGPYSVTVEAAITHTVVTQNTGGTIDVTVPVSVPDGGTTLTLLGCALIGLGALGRKFSA